MSIRCYESIASTSNEPPPGYLRMKPLLPTHSEPSSYDAPFIVPIPLVQDSYESMLNQVLGGECRSKQGGCSHPSNT